MTNGDIVFISNSPFFVDRTLRLSFQVFLTRESEWICFRYFNTCSIFKSCKFPWSTFTIHSLRNRMNSSGEFWRNCILHFGEKCWNAWRKDRFCVVIIQNSQTFQLFRYVEISRCFPRCLYSIVNDHPFGETSQLIKDQMVRKLHLYTNPQATNLALMEHWAYQLVIHLAVTWKEQYEYFEARYLFLINSCGINCALCKKYLVRDVFLLQQFSRIPRSYKFLDKNHQKLVGI